MKHPLWKVTTISGAAGGVTRDAIVNLRIKTKSDTVEPVRLKVEAVPDMLYALEELVSEWESKQFSKDPITGQYLESYAIKLAKAAIEKATT